ncbi:MAG: PDZ domain-containing protein [Janthinobacterium lividum]
MFNSRLSTLLAVGLAMQCAAPSAVRAENQMGYQLLSTQQAAGLPHNGGSLGMDIGRAQQITDGGMTFDVLQVKGVRQGSPAAQAGFRVGDELIAVDGRVFASVAAFAGYVGSAHPRQQLSVDYMPAGGGPQQAQRVLVTVGAGGRSDATPPSRQRSTGLSTGSKVAIGVGAAALFGCYEMGCFSHPKPTNSPLNEPSAQPQQQ